MSLSENNACGHFGNIVIIYNEKRAYKFRKYFFNIISIW
jgi:hypothetical protein